MKTVEEAKLTEGFTHSPPVGGCSATASRAGPHHAQPCLGKTNAGPPNSSRLLLPRGSLVRGKKRKSAIQKTIPNPTK